MKKTLAIILTILMIVTSVPFAFAAEDLTDDIISVTLKDTDNNGYYEIATADELKAFANLVNAGNTAINVELTSDIVLNENVITEDGQLSDNSESFEVWVPIGNSDVKYTGVFDGAGHVISGLYYKGNGEYAGLFGAIDGKYQDKSVGAIRDLYLIDSYFDIESSDRWFRVGGLTGYSYYAHFDNCYVEAQFNLRSTYHAASIYLGGISGMTYSTAENCFSDLAVSITKDKNASAPWVGGIYGNGSSTAVITNCHTNCDSVSTGNPQITNSTASRTAEEFENGTLCSLVGFHPCESTEGKKATCTEAGWKSQYCTACDYTTSHSEIPATGHTLTSVKAKAPTCTEVGYAAYEYCTACDYSTYVEKEALNHKDTLVQVDAKAPTCTEIGWDAYEYCTACTYTTYVELPVDADAHDWSNKDGICKVCSVECEHESYTEGVCDVCGYECPHEEIYETVTMPEHFSVQNSDGTWTKATISVVCRECESVIEYKEADRADYTEFDKYMARACELLETGNLTENAYIQYSKPVDYIKNSVPIMGSPFQSTPDTYIETLKYVIGMIEAGTADGTMIKADFTYMTSLFDEINALIDNDPNKLIPSEKGAFQGIYYGYYMSCKNNGNHSQADYDQNMADNNWEGQIEAILAGVKDGTALKADYTKIDEAIAALDKKLADVNLTDEAKAGLEEIKSQLEEMKADGNTSEADLAELEKALEDYETEVDAGIEDGTIVLVDTYKILEEYDIARTVDLEEKYGREKVDVVFLKIYRKNPGVINSIWEYADSITGTVAETADEIEELKARMDALYAAIERCIIGTHNVEEYEVVSPAKCEVNAIESGTCTLCVEVLTREVENSALKHTFTKYEVTEEAKCGVEGKEVAYCDNGCGATDEKAIEALEHLFIDYIYNEDATCTADGTKTAECVYGCGETDTVTAEDTMLNHADEDGDGICDDCETEIKDKCPDCGGTAHEGPYGQYICLIRMLIKLVVSLVKALQAVV